MLFIIPAFGGAVSWEGEGAPFKETDEDITYQVLLRTFS
jgi:pescadillo